MNNYRVSGLLGSLLLLVVSPANAELPSLATDRVPEPTGKATWFGELQRWQHGRVGAIDYRFAASGVETKFEFTGARTRAVIGFNGEHRLEAAWRTGGGDLRFAVTAGNAESGLRVEFLRQF